MPASPTPLGVIEKLIDGQLILKFGNKILNGKIYFYIK